MLVVTWCGNKLYACLANSPRDFIVSYKSDQKLLDSQLDWSPKIVLSHIRRRENERENSVIAARS